MDIGISQVSIYVEDQDAAVRFWTEKLGFTVTTDLPYGEDRWIELQPPGGGVALNLHKAAPEWHSLSTEKPNYVLFEADDINQTYEELAAKGVEFTLKPVKEHWGWSAIFKDPENHLFHLSQRS